ncbi:CS1 type fimbrial major subunit [Pseudomonas sp. NPDC079086]|uniref:CS1 type fimbrial major subunit n=1 Tax=unclassified Pseudomonas TaxID=196821 RepID=UPI0037C93C8C
MRKIMQLFITCLALLMAGRALAVEEVSYEVYVDIPVAKLYVLPVNPAVLIQLQHLQWDFRSKSFKPFLTRFNVLNSSGGFSARLVKAAVLQRGFDHPGEIALQVRLNNVLLSTTSQQVVASANTQVQLPLYITAVQPAKGYSPGKYLGSVELIFEASTL